VIANVAVFGIAFSHDCDKHNHAGFNVDNVRQGLCLAAALEASLFSSLVSSHHTGNDSSRRAFGRVLIAPADSLSGKVS